MYVCTVHIYVIYAQCTYMSYMHNAHICHICIIRINIRSLVNLDPSDHDFKSRFYVTHPIRLVTMLGIVRFQFVIQSKCS